MSFELKFFPDDRALCTAAAGDWLTVLQKSSGHYSVALSGGRIAKTFFAAITELAKASGVTLANVDFFWADERCVPPTDSESNFLLAQENLFRPLRIATEKIHRLKGELPPALAVEEAARNLRRVVSSLLLEKPLSNEPLSRPAAALSPQSGERAGRGVRVKDFVKDQTQGSVGVPVLDMIFLGLGENGHTASLMPNATAEVLQSQEPYVHVGNSPKPPPNRLTMTYPVLAAAKNIWTLVAGAGKVESLRNSLMSNATTPFGRVLQSRSQTLIYTDLNELASEWSNHQTEKGAVR